MIKYHRRRITIRESLHRETRRVRRGTKTGRKADLKDGQHPRGKRGLRGGREHCREVGTQETALGVRNSRPCAWVTAEGRRESWRRRPTSQEAGSANPGASAAWEEASLRKRSFFFLMSKKRSGHSGAWERDLCEEESPKLAPLCSTTNPSALYGVRDRNRGADSEPSAPALSRYRGRNPASRLSSPYLTRSHVHRGGSDL